MYKLCVYLLLQKYLNNMLRRFICGCEECDLSIYRQTYSVYGGSVCTPPDVLTYLANKRKKDIRFFCRKKRWGDCLINLLHQ